MVVRGPDPARAAPRPARRPCSGAILVPVLALAQGIVLAGLSLLLGVGPLQGLA